jgi:hypothetical protein
MNLKIVKNNFNLMPAIISVAWCFFIVFQFFTTIPDLDKNNKYEGASTFIMGLILFSMFLFAISLIWIVVSNVFNKIKFYVDIHYSFLILAVLIVVIIFK